MKRVFKLRLVNLGENSREIELLYKSNMFPEVHGGQGIWLWSRKKFIQNLVDRAVNRSPG